MAAQGKQEEDTISKEKSSVLQSIRSNFNSIFFTPTHTGTKEQDCEHSISNNRQACSQSKTHIVQPSDANVNPSGTSPTSIAGSYTSSININSTLPVSQDVGNSNASTCNSGMCTLNSEASNVTITGPSGIVSFSRHSPLHNNKSFSDVTFSDSSAGTSRYTSIDRNNQCSELSHTDSSHNNVNNKDMNLVYNRIDSAISLDTASGLDSIMADPIHSSLSDSELHNKHTLSQSKQVFSVFQCPEKEYGFSLKEVHTEADLVIKDVDIPPHLSEEQFDAVLIYCDEDRPEALLFKDVIERFIVLSDGKMARVSTLDESLYLQNVRSNFRHLEEAVKRSTYMFLFMTHNFVGDPWAELTKDEILQESIENPEKKWCVVPIHTLPKDMRDYPIPWGLRSLKGHFVNSIIKKKNFFDFREIDVDKLTESDIDPFFIRSMRKLLEIRLRMKLDRIDAQQVALVRWKKDELQRRKLALKKRRQEAELEEKRKKKEELFRQELLEKERLQQEKEISEMTLDDIRASDNSEDNNQSISNNNTSAATSSGLSPEIRDMFKEFLACGMSPEKAMETAIQVSQNVMKKKEPNTVVINHAQAVTIGNQNTVTVDNKQVNQICDDTEEENVVIKRVIDHQNNKSSGGPDKDDDDETYLKQV